MSRIPGKQGKPTVKDIAQAAQVSPATVSNALNNRRGVSAEIRNLIFAKAHELGYEREKTNGRPAIRLVVYKRHGMVLADTPFFASLIEGLEKQSRLSGYDLVISHYAAQPSEQAELRHVLQTDRSAGVIMLATEMQTDDLEVLTALHSPVVLLDSRFHACRYDRVLINNVEAAYTATRHLIDRGHCQIGYLHSAIAINNFYDREAGYREALASAGLRPDRSHRLLLEPTLEGACRDMLALLATRPALPTAYFADNDIIACGAMKALQASGYRIPEDVSLVGIDDMPFCELTTPRLSTVRVLKQEIGSLAVRRLMEKLAGDQTVVQIEVGSELVVRDSVRLMKVT
jgi:LacI family transcriptional regulator